MQQLLFDTPWWLPTAVIAAGIFLLLSGNRRQDKTLLRAGLAFLLLGVIVALVSYLVDTDVEKVQRKTRQMVSAVNSKDWEALRSLLDPKTAFYGYHNRDELVEGARLTADRVGLKSVRVLGMESVEHPTTILVNIRVLSEHEGSISGTFPSDWQLQWEQRSQGWFLREMRALTDQRFNEDVVKSRLVHP